MRYSVFIIMIVIFSTFSVAGEKLNIDVQKSILDYKKAIEDNVKRNIKSLDGVKEPAVSLKVRTVSSSERLKKEIGNLAIPISSIDSDQYNKIFVDSLSFSISTVGELSPKLQREIKEEIIEITSVKNIQIKFLVRKGSWSVIEIVLSSILGLFFIFSIGYFFVKLQAKKQDPNREFNEAEKLEFETMLEKLMLSMGNNKSLLNNYMHSYEIDKRGVKTLLMYLEMKFKKETILDHENLKKLRGDISYYSPQEFKVWLGGVLKHFPEVSGQPKSSLALSEVFDFSQIENCSNDDLEIILLDYTDRELSLLLSSVPLNVKFNFFETIKKIKGNDAKDFLDKLKFQTSDEVDLNILKKLNSQISAVRDNGNKSESYDVA